MNLGTNQYQYIIFIYYIRNWLMQLWKLRIPNIYNQQVRNPGESMQFQSKCRRRLMSQLNQSCRSSSLLNHCVLPGFSTEDYTQRGKLPLLSLLIQMLISSKYTCIDIPKECLIKSMGITWPNQADIKLTITSCIPSYIIIKVLKDKMYKATSREF